LLEQHGFVCCLDSDLDRYAKARALADRFPGVTLCLDHCGIPAQRDDEYFDRWSRGLGDLARAENTIVKVSGLGMCEPEWTPESIRRWVFACIEAFGVDRVVMGTNWPVDSLFSGYGDVVSAYRALLAGLSESEQRALLSGNAERVFRI
jgi:predicted TIM-barrel fold metal-dependent hydrolase